ncbi:MAG: alpha/beta fold hydrolase [Pseudomonadota bacterium]|nr:alpha/beta fold hydrolase [Pseudomonadota bacterium]
MPSGPQKEEFEPAWWLPGGHSQTLYRKLSRLEKVRQVRQRIELRDGDFIDVDWATNSTLVNKATDLIVVILHGLCGCSGSSYVLSLQRLLSENGVSSVAMNFRGCSGEMNRKARAYHSGISDDVEEVFSNLSWLHPGKNFAFVGYSLGGNVLLKWLGESSGNSRIKKAVSVSTPFSLAHCSRAMLQGLGRLYGRYFVRKLLADLSNKKLYFEKVDNLDQLSEINQLGELTGISSIWEFDDRVTAPLHGFKDAEDYYNQCSSIGLLDAIETQTLLVQSKNDPLVPALAIPSSEKLSPHINLKLSSKGGHVGFISGWSEQWLEQKILQFIQV